MLHSLPTVRYPTDSVYHILHYKPTLLCCTCIIWYSSQPYPKTQHCCKPNGLACICNTSNNLLYNFSRTIINAHCYNRKSSDKPASICLYIFRDTSTHPINHTPAGLHGKNREGRYYSAVLWSYTPKYFKKCLSGQLYQMHLKLLGFWTSFTI
jgi:hypothetical protein